MRTVARLALGFVLGAVLVQPVLARKCSCSAHDGSGSAEVTCTNGCFAICTNGGGCTAECIMYHPEGEAVRRALSAQVELAVTAAEPTELAEMLARGTGVDVRLLPLSPEASAAAVDAQTAPLGELLVGLSRSYAVALVGAEGMADWRAVWVAFQAKDRTPDQLGELLSALLRTPVAVQVAVPGTTINLQVKGVPAGKFLAHLARVAQVTVAGVQVAPAPQ